MNLRAFAGVFALGLATSPAVFGQNLLDSNPASPTFNNPSFESPDVSSVGIGATKWTASGPTIDPGLGFPILAGAGIFENPPEADPSHLAGMDGTQAGYLFANSFPDASGGPALDHAFTQVTQLSFTGGQQYQLAVALANAGSAPPANSTFTLSLFAVDASAPGGEILVASTGVQNNGSTALNGEFFVDFFATSSPISGDAVGKPIGIRLQTNSPAGAPSLTGQFDFDNVRLTAVPEPTGLALVAGAAAGLLGRRARRRR